MTEFAGRTAVITGGGSGMGASWSANWWRKPAMSRWVTSRPSAWRKRKDWATPPTKRPLCSAVLRRKLTA